MSTVQHGGRDGDDVGRRDAARAQRQAMNLARHLNERHPDTALFLARFAAGQPDATAAQLLAVADTGLTLTTNCTSAPVDVPFGTATDQPADVRSGTRALLVATRASHPHEPLTSLERQMGLPDAAAPGTYGR